MKGEIVMIELDQVTTAVCKTVRSLGISQVKEHRIEDILTVQIRSSGPEWVVSRLSELADMRIRCIAQDVDYHPEWLATRIHNGSRKPSDRLGSQLWSLDDKAFFAVTGAIRKCVEFQIPTKKQLSKWKDGVRCECKSSEHRVFRRLPLEKMSCLETILEKTWRARPWFDISDITGTNVPGAGKFVNIKVDRATSEKEPCSLLAAYEFSLSTAPLLSWKFLSDVVDGGYFDVIDINHSDTPDDGDDQGSLRRLINSKLSDFVLQDEQMMGSSFVNEDVYDATNSGMLTPILGFASSMGSIGFLQQQGGKLRTVANPNRFVQWCNVPLGQALQRVFYRQPECFVKDQSKGLEWAQCKLAEGISLSSFDMSSATDMLDYKKFISESFDPDTNAEQFPLLCRSLEFFEDCSVSPWTIPGEVQDLLGLASSDVSWSVGQPLGLRPSFPILTIMNIELAKSAVVSVDGYYSSGHFACVGDDLIIESRYAEAYVSNVEACNGKINTEKTVESNKVAEFCSQLITPSRIIPIKPRYETSIEGSLNNMEKFSCRGLTPRVPKTLRDLYFQVGSYHLVGSPSIPYSLSFTPKPLMERFAANTLLSLMNSPDPDTEELSLQTYYLRSIEAGKEIRPRDLSSGSSENSINDRNSHIEVSRDYKQADEPVSVGVTLGSVSSDVRTSVQKQIATEWDYRESKYKRRYSKGAIANAKHLATFLQSLKTKEDNQIFEMTHDGDNTSDTLLIDVSQDNPEILYSHREQGRDYVEDLTDTVPDEMRQMISQSYHARKSRSRPVPDEVQAIHDSYEQLHGTECAIEDQDALDI
uniref:RNA-dependent RNA polymerase n=1 Tax=Callamezzo narna-like virus TaxID=2716642 RepID=A0A6G7PRX2_9VIRU|nr:RNA-dependent RNA polymerase [Callamezzo narna-like virus]